MTGRALVVIAFSLLVGIALAGEEREKAPPQGLLDRTWSFSDRKLAPVSDLLTTDGVSNGLGQTVEHSKYHMANNKSMSLLREQKRQASIKVDEARKDLQKARHAELKRKRDYRREYAKTRKNAPGMSRRSAGKKAAANIGFKRRTGRSKPTGPGKNTKAAPTTTPSPSTKSNLARLDRAGERAAQNTAGKRANLDTARSGKSTAHKNLSVAGGKWGSISKLFKAGNDALTFLDRFAVGSRVTADLYDATFGRGSYWDIVDRLVEEGGRMKAVSIGGAMGGAKGSILGPGGSFVGGFVGGFAASRLYASKTEEYFKRRRKTRATEVAKALHCPSAEDLAKARARASKRTMENRRRDLDQQIQEPIKRREEADNELWKRVVAHKAKVNRDVAEEKERDRKRMKTGAYSVQQKPEKAILLPGQKAMVDVTVVGGKPPFHVTGEVESTIEHGVAAYYWVAPDKPGKYELTIRIADSNKPQRIAVSKTTITVNGERGTGPPPPVKRLQATMRYLSNVKVRVIYSKSRAADAGTIIDYLKRCGAKVDFSMRDKKALTLSVRHKGMIYCHRIFANKAFMIAKEVKPVVPLKVADWESSVSVANNQMALWVID